MATIQHDVVIDRPIEALWEVASDVRRLPEISESTVEVRGAPERLTAVGQMFTQVVRFAGKRFESTWEVTAFDPGCSLTIEGDVGYGVRYCLRQEMEAVGPVRSRFGLHITYTLPFGALGRLAGRLGVERRAAAEAADVVAGMKALVEGGRQEARPGG